jgi:hypothetical protein
MSMRKLLIVILAILFACLVSPALAADTDYFVDCSITGTGGAGSFADPFKSPEDLQANIDDNTISDGDDIYFKFGTTCTIDGTPEKIDLSNIDGTAVERTVIGCYEGAADFDCTGQTYPIIDGQDSYPSSNSEGLIHKQNSSTGVKGYITIQQIKVIDPQYSPTETHAIRLHSGGGSGGDADGTMIVDDIEVSCSDNACASQVSMWGHTQNVVKNSYFHNMSGGSANVSVLVTASYGLLVQNNKFEDMNNESVGIYIGAWGTVEKNVFINMQRMGPYLDNIGDTSIVRYNLIYNTGALVGSGTGIQTNNETFGGCGYGSAGKEKVEIYGNLIVGMDEGIIMSDEANCDPTEWYVYNNTLIDNDYSLRTWGWDFGAGTSFKNNISWVITDGAVHVSHCSPTNLTFDYNLWNTDPGTGNCDAANDPANAVPGLVKTSGWRSLTAGAETGSNFAPTEGSPVIDAGVDLVSYDTMIVTSDFTASPPTVTTGDQNDYGPPGQATLQAEPDAEDLNPTLETNAYVQPTAGSQSHDIGAVLASKDHSYTIWRLAEGDGVGDECDPTPTWTWESKSYTDLLSHVFSGLVPSTIYCWQAVFGNVAGDGVASAIDEFTTTGSAGGVEITISIAADKKVTFTLDTIGNKKATVTIRP